jgi:hypothetical protein
MVSKNIRKFNFGELIFFAAWFFLQITIGYHQTVSVRDIPTSLIPRNIRKTTLDLLV